MVAFDFTDFEPYWPDERQQIFEEKEESFKAEVPSGTLSWGKALLSNR